jgi:hypothetical protein
MKTQDLFMEAMEEATLELIELADIEVEEFDKESYKDIKVEMIRKGYDIINYAFANDPNKRLIILNYNKNPIVGQLLKILIKDDITITRQAISGRELEKELDKT